jgi:hypothetical protein
MVWSFDLKKSRKLWRIWALVIMGRKRSVETRLQPAKVKPSETKR